MLQRTKEPGRNIKPGFSAVQNCIWYILKTMQYASKRISEFYISIYLLFFHSFNVLQIVSRNKNTFKNPFFKERRDKLFLNECEGYDMYLTKPRNSKV